MLLASSGVSGASSKTYVDDLFVSYLRTGNGTSQSVTTGFQPDLVWTKSRSAATGHRLVDSTRGAGNSLESNSTLAQQSEATGITAFNSSGYSVGADSDYNTSAATYVDWVWKKAPKFFDCGTYTGNGVAGRQIPHTLGVAPGMIVVKQTNVSGENWYVYHRSLSITSGQVLGLNLTNAAFTNSISFNSTQATESVFTVGGDGGGTNNVGASYVWYAFAHDTSPDGIIQCGSFTTDGSGNATVNLGWEPQYLLHKTSSMAEDWWVRDTMRGFVSDIGSNSQLILRPNLSNAESGQGSFAVTSTGFKVGSYPTNTTVIYLAIRRPNKPPTSGTQVYNAIARTGVVGAATVSGAGFPPDVMLVKNKANGWGTYPVDRIRGGSNALLTSGTDAEAGLAELDSFTMDGYYFDGSSTRTNNGGNDYINWFFRRAPGFLSVLCDTGTGSAHTISHDLAAVPELMIRKSRSGATQWEVYFASLGNTKKLVLNSTAAEVTDTTAWDSTSPTSTQITVGAGANVNTNAATYVTYLAASLPGISKVGTYTGNGTSQTINMGFSTGCRFFLVKASSTTGNWWVFDSTRGIISSFDPALALNSPAAEITSADCVDPDSSGIVVVQEATCSLNATGVVYQYWGIS